MIKDFDRIIYFKFTRFPFHQAQVVFVSEYKFWFINDLKFAQPIFLGAFLKIERRTNKIILFVLNRLCQPVIFMTVS